VFCCCFFSFLSVFLQREISAVSRPIAAKLCHMIGNECNFKNAVQNVGSSPRKYEAENMFFGAISDDFALLSRISPWDAER